MVSNAYADPGSDPRVARREELQWPISRLVGSVENIPIAQCSMWRFSPTSDPWPYL